MDTYDSYLGAIGFNGGQGTSFAQSDAARQTGDVQRQLALAKADLSNAGQQERTGINNDAEDRGIFNSGIRGNSLAIQQGTEANKAAQLEAGAASDVGGIQASMTKQLAQEQAQRDQQAADSQLSSLQLQAGQQALGDSKSLAAQQLQYQRDQIEAQKKLWAQQLQLAQQSATSNGG